MLQRAVAEIKRRRPAIPWDVPIRVHFACDDRLLYGCRFCILRYGLKKGDHERLFCSEAEALTHIQSHGEAPAAPGQVDFAETKDRVGQCKAGRNRYLEQNPI